MSWVQDHQGRCPEGYRLDESGVYLGGRLISSTPMAAHSVLRGDLGQRWVLVEFLEGSSVQAVPVLWDKLGREDGLDPLMHYLSDVHRSNAVDLGVYLRRQALREDTYTGKMEPYMGWDLGLESFSFTGYHGLIDPAAEGTITHAGLASEWIDAVQPCLHNPRLAAAVFGALLPPLQAILGIPGFGMVWAGEPSTGKSVAVALGASVWGDPRPCERFSFVVPGTLETGQITSLARSRSDIPLCLDPMPVDRGPEILDAVLAGKDVEGGVWRSIVLTSAPGAWWTGKADQPIAGNALYLWGSPFGEIAPESALVCADLWWKITENYGHLGPAWVEQILAHREDWPGWRKGYQAACGVWASAGAAIDAAGGKLGFHLAALATCGSIFHSLFPGIKGANPQILMDAMWRVMSSRWWQSNPHGRRRKFARF